MNSEQFGSWPRWAKVLLGVWVLAAGVALGFFLFSLTTDSETMNSTHVIVTHHPKKRQRSHSNLNHELPLRPATAGTNGSTPARGSALLSPDAEARFATLESELSAQI